MTEGEKVLDGGKLGVDVFELNPPLSVYLYMPALQLARITGIAPEIIVIILVMIEIVAALVIIDRAAAAAKLEADERSITACVLAFLFAIFPSAVFGQREHIAVIAMTPFVAIAAIRWRGLAPGPVAILAGLGAGLGMSLKPYLTLVVGLPIILCVLRQRSIKPLFTPEACAAAAVLIGYGAVLAIFFLAYLLTFAPIYCRLCAIEDGFRRFAFFPGRYAGRFRRPRAPVGAAGLQMGRRRNAVAGRSGWRSGEFHHPG